MSFKTRRYFPVFFLIFGMLIIASGIASASCYVREISCSPSTACTSQEIFSGECVAYPGPSDGSCSESNTEICEFGCCCIGSSANSVMKGVCNTSIAGTSFTLEADMTTDCTILCSANSGKYYNITGYIKIGNIPVSGATISVDGVASVATVASDNTGKYSLIDVPFGQRSIIAANNTCSITTAVYVDGNKNMNVSLDCPSVQIYGYVKDDTAHMVSSPNITAFFNEKEYLSIGGADGFYNISIPYNTQATIIARDANGCSGDIEITTGTTSRNYNITLSCSLYNVSGIVIDDTTPLGGVIVSAKSRSYLTNSTGAYHLNELASGQANITATRTISEPGINSETTCTNSVIVPLTDNDLVKTINIQLGRENCCNKTITKTECQDDLYDIITRYTDTGSGACGGKTVETQSNIPCDGLPACPIVCDEWQGNCSVSGTTMEVCTASSVHVSSNCNPDLQPLPFENYKSCFSGCGDGTLNTNSGEECDYVFGEPLKVTSTCANNWDTEWNTRLQLNIDMEDLTEAQKTTMCNAATCKCMPLGTKPNTTCTPSEGSITSLDISSVTAEQTLNLKWAMSSVCIDYIDHFELRMCNNLLGECKSGIYSNIIDTNIGSDSRSYSDTDVAPDTNYCYKLTAVFNDSIASQYRTTNITACNFTGTKACTADDMTSWCSGNDAVKCNDDNSISVQTCGAGMKCTVTDGVASCVKQAPCDICNDMFGIFGYQGYIIDTGVGVSEDSDYTYVVLCPSLQLTPRNLRSPESSRDNEIDGCYIDYSMTTVDKVYSCNETISCYDYFSETACLQDYCGKFTLDGENLCEWINQTSSGDIGLPNAFRKGVCRPKNVPDQECGLCNDIGLNGHNRLDYKACSENTCEKLFGECYFEPLSTKCIAKSEVTCNTYTNPRECIGTEIPRNVSTDVQWGNPGNERKISGTHYVVNSSDGGYASGIVGLCRWDNESESEGQLVMDISGSTFGCFRDADNYTGRYGGKDCNIQYGANATLWKILMDTCEHDTIPPVTTIYYGEKYGLMMNLTGQVSVSDNNPWGLGDNSSCTPRSKCRDIRMYYCIVSKDSPACYPTSILPVTSSVAYTANLSRFTDSEGLPIGGVKNDGDYFTMYYFSEDPAKNLEYPIKNFTFRLDATPPDIRIDLTKKSYQVTDTDWLTNFTVKLSLGNNPEELSFPVRCTFSVTPIDEDAELSFISGYKYQYDIPSISDPSNDKLINSQGVLSTTYPALVDGNYEYSVDCADSVGNHYTQIAIPFNITGNVLITNPKPYMSTPYNGTAEEIADGYVDISVDTSVPGSCAYTRTPYNDMTLFDSDDALYHHSTVTLSASNMTGIYKYYVLCNLTINDKQYYNIRASDMANPIFAIDDLAPATKISILDLDSNSDNWSYYNESSSSSYERATVKLECNDSTPMLTLRKKNMAFGCQATYYCIVPKSDVHKCDAVNSDTYELAPSEGISFDYSYGSYSEDKINYGSNPVIYYYSVDNGGNSNIDTPKKTVLHIRNKQLYDPKITLAIGPDEDRVTDLVSSIDATFITITAEYFDEDFVNITNYSLSITSKNNLDVPMEIVGGTSEGSTTYKFRRSYVENGKYNFTIKAVDDDNNTNKYSITFTIKHSNNTVALVSPKLGIGTTQNYQVTVSTAYSSECKYGTDILSMCPTTSCKWYAAATSGNGLTSNQTYKSFTSSNNFTHSFIYGAKSSDDGLMYVICKTVGSSDSDESFVTTSFHVGYNSSIPGVNITFIQNPRTWPKDNSIINSSYNATIVQVFTDQPAVCAISSTNSNALIAIDPAELFKSSGNTESYVSYDRYYTVHNYTVDFRNSGASDGIYRYTINCTSRSQLSNVQETDIILNTRSSPPVMHITPVVKYLTLQRYNVTCEGLCMNEVRNKYMYKIIGYNESCTSTAAEGTAYTEVSYSQPIEITESSTICVKGYDLLGRSNTSSLKVDMVDFANGPIQVENPYVYEYRGINNKVYSGTKAFVLRINTIDTTNDQNLVILSSCKILPWDAITEENSWEEIYNIDTLQGINYMFNQTGSDIHTSDFEIRSVQNYEDVWEVVCLAPDSNKYTYFGKELFFQWDDSAPGISVDINPKLISDWSFRTSTKLNVTTDDDSMCSINLSKSSVIVQNKDTGSIVTESLNYTEDVFTQEMDFGETGSFNSYVKNRSSTYTLPKKWTDINSININATYNFYIDCINRALLSGSSTIDMNYDLARQIIITMKSSNVSNGTKVPFNIETNIASYCVASIDNGTKVSLATSDGLVHSANFSGARVGTHLIDVSCEVQSNADIGSAHETYTVYVDMAIPKIIDWSSSVKNSSCSIKGFNIIIAMYDDVGIAGYSYTISGPDITPELVVVSSNPNETNRTISFDKTLQNGKIYTANIKAVDLAGKYSNTLTIAINTTIGKATCGNGCLDDGEECDGNTTAGLNSQTCESFIGSKYSGGELRCKSDCTYDFSKCDSGDGWCGDGDVQGPNSAGIYEQCDGSRPKGVSCKLLGFEGGSVSCNDNCMINTSKCTDKSTTGMTTSPKCNNKLLESGEQCEIGGSYDVLCTSFGYTDGTISCGSSCIFDLSKCSIEKEDNTDHKSSKCGNNVTESGEKCDGTSGLGSITCAKLGNFTGGTVSCNKNCTYNISKCTAANVSKCLNGIKEITESDIDCGGSCAPCAINKTCFNNTDCASGKCSNARCIINPCNNSKFDSGTESDIDCGKSCSKLCELGKNCTSSTDCKTGFCINKKCANDPCSNDIKDGNETDVDCGGRCSPCGADASCLTNEDCSSNVCKKNICKESGQSRNPVQIPLLIIGIVLMFGGGGYILYKTFAEEPSLGHGHAHIGPGMARPMTMPKDIVSGPVKLTPEQEEMARKQREAMIKRRQMRAEERKSVLGRLDESEEGSGKKSGKESEKGKDKDSTDLGDKDSDHKDDKGKTKKDSEKSDDEYVDITELKGSKEKSRKETFEKLKSIGAGAKTSTAASSTQNTSSSKASGSAEPSSTSNALDVDATAKKIASMPGSSKSSIKPALNKSDIKYTDAIKMFGDIDRDTLMSGAFKEVVSDLLDSKKITKEHVSNVLFEYMDKGLLTKGDVAKISSELKLI